jgi:hypothetical protein
MGKKSMTLIQKNPKIIQGYWKLESHNNNEKLNKWSGYTKFIPFKLIYKFSSIPIKILTGFLFDKPKIQAE